MQSSSEVIPSVIMMNLTIFFGLFAVLLSISLHTYTEYFTSFISYFYPADVKVRKSKTLFTAEQLQSYNGFDNLELYLAILGNVYDVTKGIKHYGPGEAYNFFVGRDASRAFVTGDFNSDENSEDVTGLTFAELRSLNHWIGFYTKQYKKIGKVVGRYYDKNGSPTPYAKEIKKLIAEAERAKETDDIEKTKFPPCNMEWDADKGTKVWCTNRSGGIERNWVGVPRQYYEPGSESYRCACVDDEAVNSGNVKPYESCDESSPSCYIN